MSEEENKYRYFAFISYKSEDVKWAKWLQRKLERYSLPTVLRKKHDIPKRLSPVFRDGTDILPRELKKELNDKLSQSRYLIIICSPRSAASDWVGDEIDDFCRMGRRDRVIAVIVEGIPYSDDPATECYHPELKKWFPKGKTVESDRQLLGADIHASGPGSSIYKRERAFIQVVATILGLPFDDLWNRRFRHMIIQTAMAALILAVVMISLWYTWAMGRPFDVDVTLNERTPHNGNLPFRNGTLTLVSGTDTLGVRPVNNIGDTLVFRNIPGKFRGSGTRLVYDMYGYMNSDTSVLLTDTHVLDIRRDDTYAVFAGTVIAADGITPLSGVDVQIDGKSVKTDAQGHFGISFPIQEQQLRKHVTIRKDGYGERQYDLQPQRNHILVLRKNSL